MLEAQRPPKDKKTKDALQKAYQESLGFRAAAKEAKVTCQQMLISIEKIKTGAKAFPEALRRKEDWLRSYLGDEQAMNRFLQAFVAAKKPSVEFHAQVFPQSAAAG
jgi:hypothetical protein